MIGGVQYFRATFFAQCKMQEPTDENTTRGESVEFSTYTLEGKVLIPQNGTWRKENTFETQADAITYLEGLFAPTPSV